MYCIIVNFKVFNEFIVYYYFKMDILEVVVNMMRLGCFMVLVDLKGVYYIVFIYVFYQKYLKFCFDGVFYKYICLLYGLVSVLCIFIKLLKFVYVIFWSMGYFNLGYIDDFYL